MAVSHSVKERTISENSLIILLQGLQGQVTTVDLRDESVARGRIDNVDAFMNIRLAEVTYTDRWGHQVKLDDLFVTGRNVRYVHIPDDVNITATIEQQLQLIHRVRNFGGKGQGRREFPSKNYIREAVSSASPSSHSGSAKVVSQLPATPPCSDPEKEAGPAQRLESDRHLSQLPFTGFPLPDSSQDPESYLSACGLGVGKSPSSDHLHLNP
ncbi:U7 snRNA-associated Sm-like protein LSm10 [Dasypus novemcinctus]|uniref:U7 snRNA-associated Sm-like protein LSm10 n=1 Tax=Dasypus novemcinctus TaxID=9361 RepID=UPI00265E4F42|nr:U7 snRNA-associated Sm-like protein LSm10 [Dasypus novemcinctus]XP_012385989.2 U7 snRNA-associated Sm-like protein LSm10 [Dasypus novemcinctus]XP_012385990.2 U7 snRNA-associated Sm-like protein LSm10 [Dasypus novemcinctus]XP_023438500.2 U7 snRNA-associated Sm-like protein LSm10 [Dasypus novemcinctus]XP_023438501.2 U7 snRNA-associated Sm-like protein LSm10 [Dasypus novemcinctus]XP_023438502.2 U7 snRNA-associated Sm-like protein LSm10 [Dasypus novemcinctus]XP_023438503.2 U7 snRNA-associated 